MLLNEINYQAISPQPTSARDIGLQIYNAARGKAYELGQVNDTKKIADRMANQFYSAILTAIDNETRFHKAKSI